VKVLNRKGIANRTMALPLNEWSLEAAYRTLFPLSSNAPELTLNAPTVFAPSTPAKLLSSTPLENYQNLSSPIVSFRQADLVNH
jgi:hypothetical protein